MDRKKGLLNVSVAIVFKVVTMLLALVVKKLLIQICGNEVNGLNALYASVIGFLSVAELGVGSAITFCMYKPIVEGDRNQVSALYQLFRRCYRAIGAIILVCGLAITPFLRFFVKDYENVGVNLHLSFVLMLISVVISYLFGAKTSLMNAYKNNYISTAITSGGTVLQYALQIVVLLCSQSFMLYLICRSIAVLVQWTVTEVIAGKKYSDIIANKQKVSKETGAVVVKSIKAMFMHKVGTLLVNTADNVIISIFVGVLALGKYSNYITIMEAMTGVLQMIFVSLTSIIGHLCVRENKHTSYQYCTAFHILNYIIGMIFFLGYYAVIDGLINVLFGAELVSERSVAFVVSLNGFIQFMRRSVLMFRDATGLFYKDRWKPLFEGGFNIVLSVILAKRIGVVGVIIATIITNLLICHVIEPHILYKYAFSTSTKTYYLRNYGFVILFVIGMFAVDHCLIKDSLAVYAVLMNGCISIGVSLIICACVLLIYKNQMSRIIALLKVGKEIKDE